MQHGEWVWEEEEMASSGTNYCEQLTPRSIHDFDQILTKN